MSGPAEPGRPPDTRSLLDGFADGDPEAILPLRGLFEHLGDRPQAVGPFGMARGRQMFEVDRMRIETCGHARSIGRVPAICHLALRQGACTRKAI